MFQRLVPLLSLFACFPFSAFAEEPPSRDKRPSAREEEKPVEEVVAVCALDVGLAGTVRGSSPMLGGGLMVTGRAGGVGLRFQIVDLAVAWTENGRAGEGGSVFKVGATYHPLTSRVLSPFVGGTVGFGSWKLPAEAKGVGILDGWGLELDSVVGVTVPLGSFRWQIEVVGTLPAYTLRWEPKDGGRAPEQDDLFHIRGGLRTGLGWVF